MRQIKFRGLNEMQEHFTGLGFELTMPADKYWQQVFNRMDG